MIVGGPALERGPSRVEGPKMRADSEISALLDGLLEAGVSPRYVSRLAAELEDHYEDLEAEALRFGVPPDEASADAKRRLGAAPAIASEFAKRPELRSWLCRSVWLADLLRTLSAAYVVAVSPFRTVLGGHGVVLRYTAATAAGTGVTLGLLLLMTLLLSPPVSSIEFLNGDSAILRPDVRERLRARPPASAGEPAVAPAVAPVGPRSEIAARPTLPPRGLRSSPAARPSTPEHRVAVAAGLPSEPFWTQPALAAPQAFAPDPRELAAMLQPSLDLRRIQPIAQKPPSYPSFAARRGIEGYVVVEFTVTRHGEVHAPVIVESSSSIFHEAALEAASGLRYRPRIIGGETVDVVGVRTVIRFELDV